MTGMELANSAASDLRDRAHTQYPLSEKLAYLKRAARLLTNELAAMGHPLASRIVESGSGDWPATVTPGQSGIALPLDYLRTVSLWVKGRESEGALGLIATAQLLSLTGTTPAGYYLLGGAVGASTLHLAPAPVEALTLVLHYAALPAWCRLPEPANETEAGEQLSQEVPYSQIFGEAMRQFVSLSCANRNEYDTTVEQGLWKLCRDQAHQLAAQDNLQAWDMGAASLGVDSGWGGR